AVRAHGRAAAARALVPELVAAEVRVRPQLRGHVRVRSGVEQRNAVVGAGARRRGAVVLVRDDDDRQQRVRAQEPLVLGRCARAPAARWCSKPQPCSPSAAMQVNTSAMSGAVKFAMPLTREMNVAPPVSVVSVQVPRGAYWKMPFFPPVLSQLATLPSPAPIS